VVVVVVPICSVIVAIVSAVPVALAV